LVNQIRGLLAEHGVAMGRDISRLRRGLRQIADGVADGVGEVLRDLVRDVHQELAELDQRIATYNRRIRHLFRTNEECQRIGKIEGIGPITATALVAAVGDRAASRTDASLPPGSDWFPSKGRVAGNPGYSGSTNAATDICAP
jgi:transposase